MGFLGEINRVIKEFPSLIKEGGDRFAELNKQLVKLLENANDENANANNANNTNNNNTNDENDQDNTPEGVDDEVY
jgi:uncharacterized phage infection (PIP) family protein YhgE